MSKGNIKTNSNYVFIEFDVFEYDLLELRNSAKIEMAERVQQVRDEGWEIKFKTGLQYINMHVDSYERDSPSAPKLVWRVKIRREFTVFPVQKGLEGTV